MKRFRGQEIFRILVIAAMMASLTSAVCELALRFAPGFDPSPIVALSFLVCLEGMATARLARQLPESTARLRFHLAEWVVILVFLRLTISLSQGWEAFARDAARWVAQPQSLLNVGLVLGALLLFLVWSLALQILTALEAAEPEEEAPPPKDSAAYYAWLTRPPAASRSVLPPILVGGVVLLLCSGLARLDISSVLTLRNPAIAGIIANALLYFVLGFTLLSQGHYALLHARWQRQDVPVASPLARRWVVMGLTFTVGVALAVLLLPVRPSLALLGTVFEALLTVIFWIWQIIAGIIILLGYLLSLLLGKPRPNEGERPTQPPLRFPTLPAQPAPTHRVAWWEAVQGLVLWAIVAGAVVYATSRFLRERRALWKELGSHGGPLQWVVALLAALWHWVTRTGGRFGAQIRALVRRPGATSATPRGVSFPWFRPRNIREQVRLFYLVSLPQLARLGWPRQRADTPYEYARRLEPDLPEGSEEWWRLTQAFVEARYSRREFTGQEVGPLRAAYQRLRQALRRRSVGGRPDQRGPVDGQ